MSHHWAITVFACHLMIALIIVGFHCAGEDPEKKALIARADRQHELWLAGDDRGLYGDYPPADL